MNQILDYDYVILVDDDHIYKNENLSKTKKKLDGDRFFYLEKNIRPKRYEELMMLGDKSISSEANLIRLYPQDNLFSHIIGQIDNDNNGISGIEKFFDKELKELNEPLKLTVDTDIQFLIREELLRFQKIFEAKGSAAILMNINKKLTPFF